MLTSIRGGRMAEVGKMGGIVVLRGDEKVRYR